ncbi:MAG: hypothetical protein NVS4B13_08400 [Candidatus Elarobacter sp.]
MTFGQALPGLIGTVFYATGTALAFFAPRTAVWIYVVVTVYSMLPGLFVRRSTGEATGGA